MRLVLKIQLFYLTRPRRRYLRGQPAEGEVEEERAEPQREQALVEVLVRRGCRVQSCEDYTAFDGRKGLLICYRSLTLPDAPRLVRAARIIETRGFERAA